MSQKKAIFFKILKHIGITLITLLTFLFIAPYIFADKINAEIKKVANENLIPAKEIAFGIDVSSLMFGKSVNIDKIFLSNTDINVKVRASAS